MARSKTDLQTGHSVLSARSVSRGSAIGTAVCLYGRKRQFNKLAIDDTRVEKEIRRFRASIRLAKQQLKRIASVPDAASTGVFDMHLM
ncbi:MAG TPA: phosphoenolpyruvate-utilizing N-terminal domain-containing protein, partial [Pyrinomonadaceae bacterium]|nr:phosphoenolpyruvate-utilizing N-terminal domain-containing protein [Pyrinomonadaceae bacterium]